MHYGHNRSTWLLGSSAALGFKSVFFRFFFLWASVFFQCGLKSQKVICGKGMTFSQVLLQQPTFYYFFFLIHLRCLFLSFCLLFFFFFSWCVCLLLSYKDFYCLYHLFNIFFLVLVSHEMSSSFIVVVVLFCVIKYWQHPFARYSY